MSKDGSARGGDGAAGSRDGAGAPSAATLDAGAGTPPASRAPGAPLAVADTADAASVLGSLSGVDLASARTAAALVTPATTSKPTPAPATRFVQFEQGARIDHYEIIRELGRGGMGQVYLARDTKLGRRVAIKFVGGASQSFTDRFQVEARATARCSHENIVVIHDVNEHQGVAYMVLEYLEGEPLSEIISDRKLPPGRAVELIVPVVRALASAHEFDIVHRDLKPQNIFLTSSGLIKVLDFGIAKLFSAAKDQPASRESYARLDKVLDTDLTMQGALLGTLPYMSPEQLGTDDVDHRADIWAVGIILYEMVAGRHPLAPTTPKQLLTDTARLDQPMPPVALAVPELPGSLERIIDRCLRKRKGERFETARELLANLEELLPGRYGRKLGEGESPYPGLSVFQENDADRFFGRSRDIARLVTLLSDRALVGVVGPSGVGKSSFVRAGVVPALKSAGDAVEVLIVRPGRDAMGSLASAVHPLTGSSSSSAASAAAEQEVMARRLRDEPGYLGAVLRERARTKRTNIVLFIDQFEEIYALEADPAARHAFLSCLAGVADVASSPLRVVVALRSDFLDRVAEEQFFMEELTRGLIFLRAPDRDGLREALVAPVEMVGYEFEDAAIVDQMLDALETTSGALPLLQFAAARLWDGRDRRRRLLTRAAFEAMGGIEGTLASHADEVLASLAAPSQKVARTIFQRLVTPDRTRAIVDVSELETASATADEVQRLVDHLVQARLLVVQTRSEAEEPAVELVHESLIERWPTLRYWLEEGHEDAAFLEQLRSAAKQWSERGRPIGLLWRGEAAEEARRWHRRYQGELPKRDLQYLEAVFTLDSRQRRLRRLAVTGTIGFLVALVVAAGIALLWIRDAEQEARDSAARATEQAVRAENETARARKAEEDLAEKLHIIEAKEAERQAAQQRADEATGEVRATAEQLRIKNEELALALERAKQQQALAERQQALAEQQRARAESESKKAHEATEAERRAKAQLQRLLDQESARVKELERERKRVDRTFK